MGLFSFLARKVEKDLQRGHDYQMEVIRREAAQRNDAILFSTPTGVLVLSFNKTGGSIFTKKFINTIMYFAVSREVFYLFDENEIIPIGLENVISVNMNEGGHPSSFTIRMKNDSTDMEYKCALNDKAHNEEFVAKLKQACENFNGGSQIAPA